MRRLVLLSLLVLAVLPASAHAGANQSLTFEAPRDLLDPAVRPAALAELSSLGVRSLRVILVWKAVAPAPDAPERPGFEPTDPTAYRWGEYDNLMAAAQAVGWPVLVTISGPVPRWATQAKRDNLTRPSASAFAAFAAAVGRRYGDQVSTWSIWNEPNQPQFLRPQYARGGRAVSPRIYRSLFQAAVRGLRKAGQENDTILLGETSPRGTTRVVPPLAFLRGTLCLSSRYRKQGRCPALDADGYAHHAYTTRQGPSFRPPNRDDVTIGVLSRLTRALDRARAAGALTRRLPLYLTEFGTQSHPDRDTGVPLERQPEYYATAERIARSNSRVVSFSQYLLRDDPPTGPRQYGGFESGLRFADGRPKPGLAGFRLPLAVRARGARASVWGRVRPVTAPARAEVLVADRGRQFRSLRAVQTDAQGAFTFSTANRRGRRWRLRWTAPGGQVFLGPPIRAYR